MCHMFLSPWSHRLGVREDVGEGQNLKLNRKLSPKSTSDGHLHTIIATTFTHLLAQLTYKKTQPNTKLLSRK